MMLLSVTLWTPVFCLLTSVTAHTGTFNSSMSSSTQVQAPPSTKAAPPSTKAAPATTVITTTTATATATATVSASPVSSAPPSSSSSSSPPALIFTPPTLGPPATFTPPPIASHKPGVKNPKRGIGFASNANTDDIINANQTKSLLSWVYDWANLPQAYLAESGLKYFPMQWGSGNIDQLASAISAQKADTLLAFNEPDFTSESNIAPGDAVALWNQFIQPLKSEGVRLGGPAVTAAPTGKAWLTDFVAKCTNCSIDFMPIHWYGEGTESFFNYIWDIHNTFPQYPIWVTEFADTSDNDTLVWQFMNESIIYLDSLDWIERYAWFGYFRPQDLIHYNMLNDNGSLNDLGKLYIGADTIHTSNRTTGPQYQTVSPSDLPGQAIPTAWPALSAASHILPWSWPQGCILVTSIVMGALATLI